MPDPDSRLTRIGVFYDGNYFAHVRVVTHYLPLGPQGGDKAPAPDYYCSLPLLPDRRTGHLYLARKRQ
jgi:hypothetical protein